MEDGALHAFIPGMRAFAPSAKPADRARLDWMLAAPPAVVGEAGKAAYDDVYFWADLEAEVQRQPAGGAALTGASVKVANALLPGRPSLVVNEHWLRAFAAVWEEANPWVAVVKTSNGVKGPGKGYVAFCASAEFARQLHKFHRARSNLTRVEEDHPANVKVRLSPSPRVRESGGELPPFRETMLTREWDSFCEWWCRRHNTRGTPRVLKRSATAPAPAAEKGSFAKLKKLLLPRFVRGADPSVDRTASLVIGHAEGGDSVYKMALGDLARPGLYPGLPACSPEAPLPSTHTHPALDTYLAPFDQVSSHGDSSEAEEAPFRRLGSSGHSLHSSAVEASISDADSGAPAPPALPPCRRLQHCSLAKSQGAPLSPAGAGTAARRKVHFKDPDVCPREPRPLARAESELLAHERAATPPPMAAAPTTHVKAGACGSYSI
eukprot:TRINITY_DN4097_c0_g7_i1.p1 TRINITY_DN4097_c0_g7~~TRINITY_DN4097_c0_g7_i1.p1  ORF type:complete len:454 (+),score=89.08 TRINITY_DN4097_c0_g7_i1:55-1362(+)